MLKKIKNYINTKFINPEYPRQVWLAKTLESLPKGESILDIGAGECQYKKHCSHLNYISQDFGKYDGNGDTAGMQMGSWDNTQLDIISDLCSIPVKDASFDNIMITEVLEHVPEPGKAVQEAARILKTGGKMIITSPFCSQTHFAPYHFMDGFNIYWYEFILKQNNMEMVEFKRNGNFYTYMMTEMIKTPKVIKRYSNTGFIYPVFYLIFIPMSILFMILSKFNKNSEEQLCSGYFIIARKLNQNSK